MFGFLSAGKMESNTCIMLADVCELCVVFLIPVLSYAEFHPSINFIDVM